MEKTLTMLGLMVISLATAGCFEEEDSCNIRTPGIYVEYEVLEENYRAIAVATFWTGDNPGGTYLKLGSCGDSIAVNGVPLEITGSNPKRYEAGIDRSDEYNFVLDRPDEATYPSSISNMPAEVVIEQPDDQEIPRDEEFTVRWDDGGSAAITLQISSDCFDDYPNARGSEVTDNSWYTIEAGTLAVRDEGAGNTCAATVTLTRIANGDLNENLKGTIVGKTRDTASFQSTPATTE